MEGRDKNGFPPPPRDLSPGGRLKLGGNFGKLRVPPVRELLGVYIRPIPVVTDALRPGMGWGFILCVCVCVCVCVRERETNNHVYTVNI